MTICTRLGLDDLPGSLGTESPGRGAVGPAWVDTPDGTPIVGMEYVCNAEGAEEAGITELPSAIRGTNPRSFSMRDEARTHVAAFADVNGLVISSRPLGLESPPLWGDPIAEATEYAPSFGRRRPWVQGFPGEDILCWQSAGELRDVARSLGVRPLPRRKDQLLAAVLGHPRLLAGAERPNHWPAYFRHGDALIVRADIGPSASIVEGLRAAITAGTLGVGGLAGPFSRGLFIFDAADMGPLLLAQVEADFDRYDVLMEPVEALRTQIAGRGALVRFLGNPTEIDTRDGQGRVLRYWLDAFMQAGPRKYLTLSGWYTLSELQSGAYVEIAGREKALTAS